MVQLHENIDSEADFALYSLGVMDYSSGKGRGERSDAGMNDPLGLLVNERHTLSRSLQSTPLRICSNLFQSARRF
jgi:hypothetical protein